MFYICAMPNHFDKIIKENLEALLPDLLRITCNIRVDTLKDVKDKIQATVEREADTLKKVVHENAEADYLLHLEFQTTDEDMCARNLLYYGLDYHRHRLPVRQIVIYLGNEPAKKIRNNQLNLRGISLEFEVVDLRSLPKDLFLQSETPEGVIMAVLADFGQEKPVEVIRQILTRLDKLVRRVPSLRKYQKQLHILSRLRKLDQETQHQINTMPIHYDIETDFLYQQGIEKGIEKGAEKNKKETVINMLQMGKYSLYEITVILGVTKEFVLNIAQEHQLNVPD